MRVRTLVFCLPAVVLGFVSAFSRASAASEKNFDGVWEYTEYVKEMNKPYSIYRIALKESSDGRVGGYYCFVTQGGNRLDCDSDGSKNNISGRVLGSKDKAVVHFSSFFGAKDGVAELTIEGQDLRWTIIVDPKGGFFYGPRDIKLSRVSPDAHRGERKIVTNRSFLYTSPAINSKSGVYIIKGDYVKLLSLSIDRKFWKISFKGKAGDVLLGWIECGSIDFCP